MVFLGETVEFVMLSIVIPPTFFQFQGHPALVQSNALQNMFIALCKRTGWDKGLSGSSSLASNVQFPAWYITSKPSTVLKRCLEFVRVCESPSKISILAQMCMAVDGVWAATCSFYTLLMCRSQVQHFKAHVCVCVCTSQKQHSGSPDQPPLPHWALYLHMKTTPTIHMGSVSNPVLCRREMRHLALLCRTQQSTVCACVCVFVRGLCPKNTEISAFWKLHPLLYEHKVFHTSLFVLSHTSALKYIIWDAAPSLSVWFTGVILVRMTAWLLRRYDMLSKRLQGVVSFPKDEQRTSASQRHPESKRLHSHTLQAHHPLLL